VHSYAEVIHRRGGEHATGRKLYQYFRDAGVPVPQLTLDQSVSTDDEAKELALSTLDATAAAILSEGIATRDDIDAALSSLRGFTDDSSTLLCLPGVVQVWARR
jgi:hypothetical protein